MLLGCCDQREVCRVLAELCGWLVRQLAPADQEVLMGALRKAALGQRVHLVSGGQRLREEP